MQAIANPASLVRCPSLTHPPSPRSPLTRRTSAFPPDSLGLQEARFLVGNLSTLYAPELVPGITPACCSDHQSFGSLGFASTWVRLSCLVDTQEADRGGSGQVFERNGPIADPFYHNSGDLVRSVRVSSPPSFDH